MVDAQTSTTVTVVFEVIAKTTAVLGVAALASVVSSSLSAASRHRIWYLALVGVVLMPILVFAPGVSVATPAPLLEVWRAVFGAPASATVFETPVLDGENTGAPTTGELNASSRPAGSILAWLLASPLRTLGWLWLAGTILMAARIVIGIVRTEQLVRRGRELAVSPQLKACLDAVGVSPRVRLIESGDITVPMTYGALRHVLLVPTGFKSWASERRRVVLVHELAHIRRADCFTQLVAQFATALYWFHPLAWYAESRLRHEAEKAADDQVLDLGMRASDYASHLLAIVRTLNPARPGAIATVAMANSSFEERVSAILEPNRRRGPMSRIFNVLATTALIAGVAVIGVVEVKAGPDHRHMKGEMRSHEGAEKKHKMSPEEVRASFQSIQSNPEATAKDWHKVAMSLHTLGDYDDAIMAWQKTADLGSNSPTVTYNLACALSLNGDTDAALDALAQSIQLGFDKTKLLRKDSDLDNLRDIARFAEIVETSDLLILPKVKGANAAFMKPSWAAAADRYQGYVDDNPESARGQFNLGYAALVSGDTERAKSALSSAYDLGFGQGRAAYNLACAHALTGNKDDAFHWLDRAIEADPVIVANNAEHDSDLASIRSDARFPNREELIATYPEAFAKQKKMWRKKKPMHDAGTY